MTNEEIEEAADKFCDLVQLPTEAFEWDCFVSGAKWAREEAAKTVEKEQKSHEGNHPYVEAVLSHLSDEIRGKK